MNPGHCRVSGCARPTAGAVCLEHDALACRAELHDARCDQPAGHPGQHHFARPGVDVQFPDDLRTDHERTIHGLAAWRAHVAACEVCESARDDRALCAVGAELFAALEPEPGPWLRHLRPTGTGEPTDAPQLRLRVVPSVRVPGELSVRLAGPDGGAAGSIHREITRLFREGDVLTLTLEHRP